MRLITFVTVALTVSAALAYQDGRADTNVSYFSPFMTDSQDEEVHCLALNIYHESRSDNLAGQFAVADVVLNRVRDSRWPNTICEVVKEGPISKWWKKEHNKEVPIRNRCQFSWYCDGKSDDVTQNDAWVRAQMVAHQILKGKLHRGLTEGATHYHATYVKPSWSRAFTPIGRIGLHIFYRAEDGKL